MSGPVVAAWAGWVIVGWLAVTSLVLAYVTARMVLRRLRRVSPELTAAVAAAGLCVVSLALVATTAGVVRGVTAGTAALTGWACGAHLGEYRRRRATERDMTERLRRLGADLRNHHTNQGDS